MLLAVDPGIRGCGLALFDDARLRLAAYLKNGARSKNIVRDAESMGRDVWRWAPSAVTELVVEWPQIYATRIRSGESKGDPNDLLGLAAVDAAIAAHMWETPVGRYLPREWKGQLTKEACHHRILSRLDDGERQVLAQACEEAGSLAHNVMDAVGIGLHHIGRLKQVRVIPV